MATISKSRISQDPSPYCPSRRPSPTSPRFYSSLARWTSSAPVAPQTNPIRVSLDRCGSPPPFVAFSASRHQERHNERKDAGAMAADSNSKRTCSCSPTTHPGSFRCSFHKKKAIQTTSYQASNHHLHLRRSAVTNSSLVRIGMVEGELMKRILAAMIRPSSHSQRRRVDFQLKASRFKPK